MSARPRSTLARQHTLSLHASLSSAAALLRSTLTREREKVLSPLPLLRANPKAPIDRAGLTPGDTLSRCLATPTASPLWKQSRSCQTPHSLPPAYLMTLVRASSLLSSCALRDNPAHSAPTAPEIVPSRPCLAPVCCQVQRCRAVGSLCCSGHRSLHLREGRGCSLSVLATADAGRFGQSKSAREFRSHRVLGPLIGHNVLRAASSFHFLHGGLADVASFAHHAPLDGANKAKASHDPRAQVSRSPKCIASDTEALPAEEVPAGSTAPEGEADSRLRLVSGACALPHPDKAEKGGEDAFFISNACHAVGVADGVGGWADVGVDAGAYARELMTEAMDVIEREGPVKGGHVDPLHVLEAAHAKTASQGSSTACVILLSDQKLAAANLGDSGFMIIRSGRTIFKSPPQQHDFNFPYQLGSAGGDPPSNAEVYSLPVAPGDVIVLGTDGLFDNVFDGELASMVMHSLMAGRSPQSTAEHIAALARIRAADRVRFSPFARAAMEAGYRYYGGKMDDITVVVSYVSLGGSSK